MPKHSITEEENLKKAGRKMIREARLEKQRAARDTKLNEQWQEWAVKYETQEEALIQGIWNCENLARDLEAFFVKQDETYFWHTDLEQNEDLTRLVQFDELKNLWLRRNQEKIVSLKKLPHKDSYPDKIASLESWDETFFSFFESVQLYLYTVSFLDHQFALYSDKVPPDRTNVEMEEIKKPYAKFLSNEEKKSIGKSFGQLVPIIAWGAQSFWRKRWSKKENRLLPEAN